MQDDDISTGIVSDLEALDLEGLWMRNRLLERLFGEVAPVPRFGDRWQLSRTTVESQQLGLPVEDDRGRPGLLRCLTKPTSALHLARLLGMIQQYANLDHEHLEPVLDWGAFDGQPWIVQPVETTRRMRDWLHEGVESWAQVIEKFLGVGRAVAELHRHGLVHGQLVPDAFFIDANGRARLGATLQAAAQRLATQRSEGASVAGDQSDLCMAIHGALLAIETTSSVEAPSWVVEVLERGFEEQVRDRWPSVDDLVDHLEHRLRMRSRLVVLRGGAAA